jgi:hypothetical protein
MELKQRIIRNLEWANKLLKLQGKELDETQLEIIEFCLLHDLQQLTIPAVVGRSEQLPKHCQEIFDMNKGCPKGTGCRYPNCYDV